jgi:hypothetical protein
VIVRMVVQAKVVQDAIQAAVQVPLVLALGVAL